MAESSISVAQDQFICSICLDLLKDPVTIPCGHSYCMSCITDCWDQDDQKRVYSCPQCRQTFTPRPVLGKNTMLAEVVEKLKKTKRPAARPAQCYTGSGDVECDVCTGDKNKAIKSCLLCLESYCQTHFERHEEFHSIKRHKMTDAIERLQEMICPQHDRLLEMYCRTDQTCVCMLCMANEHKAHDTVSPAEGRTEKQKHLEETQRKYQQRIQERQKELEDLREAVESHKRSAQAAVEDSERIFTELIHSIERSRSEVTQLIRDQEKVLISQAKGRLEQLEQEIDDLWRRDAELVQLSHTDHHIHFLQSFQSLSVPPGSTDSPSITVSSCLSFDNLRTFVSQLEEKLQHAFKEQKEHLFGIVRYIEVIPTPEYKSRNEFLQCKFKKKKKVLFFPYKHEHAQKERTEIKPKSACNKMAESSVSLAQDQFSCSICLDLLKDPVTIPCGHSYCMNCITDCWDQDDQKRVYSCPQCRQTFTTRPVLGKNTMLAEVVEKLKKTKLLSARPAQCYTGSGDVECDVCTGDKNKAIKSCLLCLESYCQTHFDRHEEFHSRKRHKMTDAIERLQEMICPQHDRLLEMYCRTDQICVCMLCMANEHKAHDTVSPAEGRTEKQKHLEETQRKYQQRIQERQKELADLREAVESHKRSAQAAVEDSERIFTELIHSIERSRSEVTQLIRDQEKVLISQADGLLEQLEQEIDDLRRRDAELEQVSLTGHIHFLQSFQSLSVPPGSTDSPSITVSSCLSFDDLRTFVSQLEEKLQHAFKEEKENLCRIVRYIEVIPTPEYKSRNEFLQYYQRFTLDSDSAHKYLRLSESNRVVTTMKKVQRHPDHPVRFTHLSQVLCRESVCGRCYWEVEWSGVVDISVSYKSISRKWWGDECRFGHNDQSWSLSCSESSCLFCYNYKQTSLPVVSSSSRIGVYVDHSAGTLSFYSVSDTMTLIHRVHTTFTQPLYPGFWVYYNAQVKLCDSA
ncbi:E3 ubiquitin/ISG15 ligase TRIM25 [Anabarilius grahami]|uniref:E3 ubiquitin/ISG15 ligase TRIM25 n=1 Tax=Anabarilius grahami TaxID=495550 RepID=A0A3N0YSU2_ANAGA|nr:E3 ubiquitin/ISG15 ligase TRIM25 [Anabarilius grahami]